MGGQSGPWAVREGLHLLASQHPGTRPLVSGCAGPPPQRLTPLELTAQPPLSPLSRSVTPCVSLMGELPDTPWTRDATERVLGGSSRGSHVAVQMAHAPCCRWSFAPECCSQRPTSGRWGRSGRQRFSRSSRCSQSVLFSCATCSPVLFLLLAPGIG